LTPAVALAVTALSVALIWIFRFLPLYDLPIWMYEARIMDGMDQSWNQYSRYFELTCSPVPNLGVVGLLAILQHFFPLEVAAKILLSLLVTGFPWAFWYAVRRVHGGETPAAYLGFPYCLNLFVFGGQAYLLGLILMIGSLGYYLPIRGTMSRGKWIALTVCLLGLYFVHAIAWFITLVVLGTIAVRERAQRPGEVRNLALAAVPSLVLFVAYLRASPHLENLAGIWGIRSVAQNIFKPMGLVVKSFGINSGWPLTLINAGWLALLVVLFVASARRGGSRRLIQSVIFPTIVTCLLLVIALPDHALGIFQPGARFTIPAYFLSVLAIGGTSLKKSVGYILLAISFVACAYNATFFAKVDLLMDHFYSDAAPVLETSTPSYVVSYDWPAESGPWDAGSASVNPLSLVPYYHLCQTSGIAWIHGTSMLHLRPEWKAYQPPLRGGTREEFEQSVLSHIQELLFFRTVIVIGDGEEAQRTVQVLARSGFRTERANRFWSILVQERGW